MLNYLLYAPVSAGSNIDSLCKIVIHCVKSGRSISIDLLSEGFKFVATIVYEVLRVSAGTAIQKGFTE